MIRPAEMRDICRLSEIEISNYRLFFYPIFKNDKFYFDELQVSNMMEDYLKDETLIQQTWVYDDGVVKGFIRIDGQQIKKLFVEPVLQGNCIGSELLRFAVGQMEARFLWALEKNTRAITFYQRHGFHLTSEKMLEEDTDEFLVKLIR